MAGPRAHRRFHREQADGAGGYGIVGAILGGFVFGLITGSPNPVNNLDIGSIVVAIVGACILIAILRAISGSRARV